MNYVSASKQWVVINGDDRMKPPPKSEEFDKFTDALRRIVQVPKKEVQAKMDAAKQERKQQHAKPSSTSGLASRDKD